jgi:PPP family 3-phenylpropionic acid transporter
MPSNRFWPAAFYFFYFAAIAAVIPFIALYYQSLGFTGGQIGLLFGISPLIGLFASPFWTGLADAGQRHKHILFITIAAVVLLMALVPFVRPFGLLLPLIFAYTFFGAPIVALVDSATLSLLGDRRDLYGRIRLWGTIGWGLSAPLVGELLQRFGIRWMFWIYPLLMGVNLITVRRLTFVHRVSPTPYWRGMRDLLANRRWVFFLVVAFVAGIGFALHNNYLVVLLESMGASKSIMGFAITVSIISELPVMFFSNFLLRRFKAQGLLFVALAVAGVRCLLYFLAGNPLTVVAIQLLHGLTFPLMWIAGVTYASENAPPGFGATAQGLFGAMMMGFGVASGGLLGGLLLDRLGVAEMYAVGSAILLTSLLILLALNRSLGIMTKQD